MLPAFQVSDFYSQRVVNDPNFVEWTAFMVESDGLVNETKFQIGIHRCTEEDFEYFYESTKSSRNKI
jgi:uncharacterized protein YktB (UPF0637 family)